MAPRLHTGQRDLCDEHLYRRSGTGRGALFGFRTRTRSVLRAGGGAVLAVCVHLPVGGHKPVLRRRRSRSRVVLPLRGANGRTDRVHNPDGRGSGMAGSELGGLGRPLVHLLATPRSGNDAASAVERRAYGHNRNRHGLDSGLPPPHRSLDALMRWRECESIGAPLSAIGFFSGAPAPPLALIHERRGKPLLRGWVNRASLTCTQAGGLRTHTAVIIQ